MILKIQHFGYPFRNNENAVVLVIGEHHYYVWLKV